MKVLIASMLVLSLASCSSTNSTKSSGATSVKTETKKETEKKPEKEAPKPMTKVAPKMEKKVMAESSDKKFQKTVTCTAGENERVLENRFSDSGGCEVVYSKDGGESVIAEAKNNLDYCQEVVDRVANKLVKAGFDCK